MLASLRLLLFLRGFGYRAGDKTDGRTGGGSSSGRGGVGWETGTMRALLPCKNALPSSSPGTVNTAVALQLSSKTS
ncbi:hypothetical protein EDB83DRAFT_2373696, partial [Lactarius deliciosus]